MSGAVLPVVLVGLAALVATGARAEIAGLPAAEAAGLVGFAAAALWLTDRAADHARPSWNAAVTAVTLWTVSMAFLGLLYGNRTLLGGAAQLIADAAGSREPAAEIGQGGEVSITRRGGGSFIVPARVNDRATRFVFDTGASTVVLAQETAEVLGLRPQTLAYTIPVGTANGMALAAAVTLDTVAIGTITLRRVRALVVRAGLLQENLLGQTFLERLASYEVRGNRLVLRAVRG